MDAFYGEIRIAAFDFAPKGWATCDGQLLRISDYWTLFSLLGSQYGGDGNTNYGLPDLRGRSPMCSSDSLPNGEMKGNEMTSLVSGPFVTPDGSTKVVDVLAPTDNNMMPYLAANFIIALDGVFPLRSWGEYENTYSDSAFTGEIRMVGFDYEPAGWFKCDGRLLAISQYKTLYKLIGTTYGGDGLTNFAIPDLRNRVPLHMGQGTGLTMRSLADKGGSSTLNISTKVAGFGEGTQSIAAGVPDDGNLQPYTAVNFIMCYEGIYPA